MREELVSVVLPTYNRADVLHRALYSIFEQDYRCLEVVVVDDCSTDNTKNVLAAIQDPRLRIVHLTVNMGPAAARNFGILASRGRWVAFLDSDAVWLPGKLSKQFARIAEGLSGGIEYLVCYSRFAQICGRDSEIHPADSIRALSGNLYNRLLHGNTMDTSSMLIRRDVFDRVGLFDEQLSNLEDWDLALRLASKVPIAFADEVLIESHLSSGGVNFRLAPESKERILQNNETGFSHAHIARAALSWSIGVDYASRGEIDKATKHMRNALGAHSGWRRAAQVRILASGINIYPALHQARRGWRSFRVARAKHMQRLLRTGPNE